MLRVIFASGVDSTNLNFDRTRKLIDTNGEHKSMLSIDFDNILISIASIHAPIRLSHSLSSKSKQASPIFASAQCIGKDTNHQIILGRYIFSVIVH